MDAVTLTMFFFVLMLGFIFWILGFFELKDILLNISRHKDRVLASAALGFIFFILTAIVWFVMSIYWTAMATDPALSTLGYLWFAFGWVSVVGFISCLGFLLIVSVKKPESSKLEIQEERRYEGY